MQAVQAVHSDARLRRPCTAEIPNDPKLRRLLWPHPEIPAEVPEPFGQMTGFDPDRRFIQPLQRRHYEAESLVSVSECLLTVT